MKGKLKRFTALCMACAMVLITGDGFWPLIAKAADESIVLQFADGTNDAVCVVNDSVEVKMIVPSDKRAQIEKIEVSALPPEGDETAIELDTISSPGKTLLAVRKDTSGTFEVRAKLYATKNIGILDEEYVTYDDAADPSHQNPITHRPSGEFELVNFKDSISTDSSLSFNCITGGESPTFVVEGTPTSYFLGYDRVSYITNSFRQLGNKCQIDVRLHATGGGKGDLTVRFISDQSVISTGTKFNLRFQPESTNAVRLTIMDPQKMVNQIAEQIVGDNSWDQFIKIRNAGDELQSLTEGYLDLLRKYGQYNDYTIYITWEWKTDNPQTEAEANVIKLYGDQDQGDTVTAQVIPVDDSITGRLTPTVTYSPKSTEAPIYSNNQSPPPSLALKVLGKGTPPRVLTTFQYIQANQVADYSHDPIEDAIKMDFYDGAISGFPKTSGQPYQIQGNLTSGTKSKQCQYVTVESTDPEAVTFEYEDDNGVTQVYDFAAEEPVQISLETPDTVMDKAVPYTIKANEVTADTYLTFTFYRNGIAQSPTVRTHITVQDTSPNRDTTLKNLEIKQFTNSLFDLGQPYELNFVPETRVYPVDVSYKVEKLRFKVLQNDNTQKITMSVGGEDAIPIKNGITTDAIALEFNVPRTVVFTVTAESGDIGTYTLNIMRHPPSDDPTLGTLTLYESDADDSPTIAYQPAFNNQTMQYEVTVPYKTKQILVEAIPTDLGAEIDFITPDPENGDKDPKANRQWVPLTYEIDAAGHITDTTDIQIKVVAEDGVANVTYNIAVKREAPSVDASLSALNITDSADAALTYAPAFAEDTLIYEVKIPYTTEAIKVSAVPKIEGSFMSLMQGQKLIVDKMDPDIFTKAIKIAFATEAVPSDDYNLVVTAEDGFTTKTYQIRVIREAPNNDATLSGVAAVDQDGGAITIDGFSPDVKDYDIEVSYSTTKVTVTPTPTNPDVKEIRVNGKKIEIGAASAAIKLSYPDSTTVKIVVTAQDGTTQATYNLNFKRKTPGKDARLKSLTVSDVEEFAPLFTPSKLKYTATIKEGAKSVTITAVPNDPLATMTINGEKAESGAAFGPIEVVEVQQTIEIVVTAEDGETTMTYTITFTNSNLVEKSANADLKSLKLQKGEMQPSFKSSTTSYEFYVTEETNDVDLFPVPADSLAKVQVFAGSVEIGDNNGNYSQSIADGENDFSVKVTSPDGKVTKEYAVTVFRNEEDKMGSLTPLTADDIDFEESPDIITIDITKRSRIAADVFTELKNYPEKTLVLQGNDYSLQFSAQDLNTIIPATQIYDFGMSFDSALKDEIMSEINSYSSNSGVEPVFMDFNYHGELPGKATFTLSLGKKYANKKLYFHYYNEERKRIDYLGYVETNSKGTFSVSLDTLGTFMITQGGRLEGSENKALTSATDEGVDLGNTEDVVNRKVNPNTGVSGKDNSLPAPGR